LHAATLVLIVWRAAGALVGEWRIFLSVTGASEFDAHLSPLNSFHTPTRERPTMRKSPHCCGLLYWQSLCPPVPTLKAMRQLSAPG